MTAATLTKNSLPGHNLRDAQSSVARQGTGSDNGQKLCDTQLSVAVVGPISPQANDRPTPNNSAPAGTSSTDSGHDERDTHVGHAAVGSISEQDRSAMILPTPILRSLADPALAFAADILDDLERTRNANANRLRVMTLNTADSDGHFRGFGLDESHPDVARLSAMVTALDSLAHDSTLNLQRKMRKHPLGPWAKAQRGIGEKQAARLLAAVGDPYWNTLYNRPRTVSELWAYCGLHTLPSGHDRSNAQFCDPGGTLLPASQVRPDTQPRFADGETTAGGDLGQGSGDTHSDRAQVAARRKKGQKSNWSTNAKTRAWLCIESCMKQIDAPCKTETGIGAHLDGCKCSPYRIVIDQRRTHTAVTHPDWTPSHSLNDSMRIASKELLKDLWREARSIHEAQTK